MEHTLLLLHGEEIIDSSGKNVPLTNQGVQASSAQSKFGGKSLYFNGNSRVILPTGTLPNTLQEFTIEWWERAETGAKSRFSTSWSAPGGLLLGYNGTMTYARKSAGWDMIAGVAMLDVIPDQWIHRAFVRKDNKLIAYKNGIKFAQASMVGNLLGSQNQVIGDYTIGQSQPFKGYMDEFRISNVARWTSDFTPPTEPYGQKPDFSYEMQVPVGSSKKIYARLYPKNPNDYFQTDLTKATVDLTVAN